MLLMFYQVIVYQAACVASKKDYKLLLRNIVYFIVFFNLTELNTMVL